MSRIEKEGGFRCPVCESPTPVRVVYGEDSPPIRVDAPFQIVSGHGIRTIHHLDNTITIERAPQDEPRRKN